MGMIKLFKEYVILFLTNPGTRALYVTAIGLKIILSKMTLKENTTLFTFSNGSLTVDTSCCDKELFNSVLLEAQP